MTYEQAVFYRALLICGYCDELTSFVNTAIEKENPVSEIILDLSFHLSDTNAMLADLNSYILKTNDDKIDYDIVADLIIGFLKQKYYKNEISLEQLASLMEKISCSNENYLENNLWNSMYMLGTLYAEAQDGYIDINNYTKDINSFLNKEKCYDMNSSSFEKQNVEGVFVKSNLSINIGIIFSAIFLFSIINMIIKTDLIFNFISFLFSIIVAVAFCIIQSFYNKDAYFYLTERGISAKFSWRTKLNCNYSDIDFCDNQLNSLHILLKNGNFYTVSHLINSTLICETIQNRTIYNIFDKNITADKLINETKKLKKQKNTIFIKIIICVVFIFANIFITVFLTEEKEIEEFSQNDWNIFAVFIIVEIIVLALCFIFAAKYGKYNFLFKAKNISLLKYILITSPFPSGNINKVFININLKERTLIYEIPNTNDFYYITQFINNDFEMETIFTSGIYKNTDEFKSITDGMTEIIMK